VNFGEKGGVRWRGGDGWLGGGAGTAAAGRGAGGGAGSGRGTGGGHVVVAVEDAGVRRDRIGLTPAGVPRSAAAGTGAAEPWRSSPQLTAAPTGMRPPHTEQRALIETLVIFAGSSRKTERHSGQDTFIGSAGWVESGIRVAAGPG
jgi:hypothetical protein